jgi:hypothetical protein
MDLTRQIGGYCERLGPGLWAEPLNAVTNLAFLLAAWAAWRMIRRDPVGIAHVLTAILALIGIGSGLFHTFATTGTAMADTLPILLFILVYVFAASRDFLGWPASLSGVAVLGVFPWVGGVTWAILQIAPGLGGSAAYASVDLLIWLYAGLLARRDPAVACNLAIGAAILAVSITARALDEPLCGINPIGTHFLWHILNATMLLWMIRTWRVHHLAKVGLGG